MKKLDEILEFLFHTKRGIATLVLGGISGTMLLGGCFVTDCLSCACDDSCDGCWGEADDCVNNCVSCSGSCDNTIFTALFGSGCTSDCGDCGIYTLSCNFSDYECAGSCSGCEDFDCSCLGCNCIGGKYIDNYTEPYVKINIVYYNVSSDCEVTSSSTSVYESSTSISFSYSSAYFTCYGVYREASTSSKQVADASGAFVNGYDYDRLENVETVYVLLEEIHYGDQVVLNFSATADGEDIGTNSDFEGVYISGSTVCTVGSAITGVPSTPSVAGYNFVGWYLNGNRVSISNGIELHLYGLGTTSSNINLVAVYESKKINVTVNVGYESYVVQVGYGATVGDVLDEIRGDVETNYGKLLGASYSSNATSYLSESEILTENCTLNVYYQEPVTITLYNADGPYTNSKTVSGYYSGDTYTLPTGDISGYYFLGWYYDEACTQSVTASTISLTQTNYSFYAMWQDSSMVRVLYYVNNELVKTQYYNYSDTTNAALWSDLGDYLPAGYELAGWCTSSTLLDTPTTVLPAGSEGTKTYYASFTPKTYTVYLDANGGSVSSSAAQVTYGEDYWLYVPTRSGYVFDGWYYNDIRCTNGDGDSLDVFSEDVLGTMFNDSVTFTARWTVASSASLEKTVEGQNNEAIITKIKGEEE